MKQTFWALPLIIALLSLASITASANANSGAPIPPGQYAVGSGSFGDSYCMRLSADGKPFGSSVPDSYCHASYGVASAAFGDKCFNKDASGQAYGSSVSDRYCQVGYAVGTDFFGASKCFKADVNGRVFGSAVSDSYCMR